MFDATPHRYRAFGLSLLSDLALPELLAGRAGDAPDVAIRRVADLPFDSALRATGGGGAVGPRRFDLDASGTGRFSVTDGAAMRVTPAPDANPATIRSILLGSAMGALLLQRGRVPLHASVVAIGAAAVAFLGKSGAGKSTLALALDRRGHAVLGDDLCSPDAGGMVSPGVTRLKLWPASLAAAAEPPEGLERVWNGWDKRIRPAATLPRDIPRPLAAIVVLGWGDTVTLAPLGGAAALEALMVNSFRGLLVAPMGIARAHMERCAALARSVPVWRLERPQDLARLDTTVDAVLDALRG